MTEKRKYEQKLRAERQEETRRRITEATEALHQEIGPAQTTISAVAERAGVERLTVYRHFPNESELLSACQQHFRAQHPLPDLAAWASVTDPAERLSAALAALYAYYEDTEAMTANILHDAPLMPGLAAILTGRAAYFATLHATLAEGWNVSGEARQMLFAAIGHALDFETWRSLARRQHLSNERAVALMARLVAGLAADEPANVAVSQG
ncbi:MAG TPA: helix-turn-helix domain-containing protein [Ktedonobacterales bacterium]|nr:helix-turn-helix domain-containing protein [Ktedonobacterales bacterium]